MKSPAATRGTLASCAALLALAACTGASSPATPAADAAPAGPPQVSPAKGGDTMALALHSSAFTAGGDMPARLTCEGGDVSPSLSWSGAPAGTKSFALIVDDPDAPDPAAPQRTWVHWVVYNLPAGTLALGEGAAGQLPAGAADGRNDWGRAGYGGPCPPIGRHRYFHKLYALDVVLPGGGGMDKAALLKAMDGHVLAQAELIGTYQKQAR